MHGALFAHPGPIGIVVAGMAALVARCVDAIAGGGSLIQLPTLLLMLPRTPLIDFGTDRVASLVGTLTAARRYLRIPVDWSGVTPMATSALAGSLFGAHAASVMPVALLNAIMLVAMAGIAI